MNSPKIGVFPGERFARYHRLFEVLAELYSVEFEPRNEANWTGCSGAVLFEVNRDTAIQIAASGLPCVAYVAQPAQPVKAPKAAICFAPISYIPQCFRGRTLPDESTNEVRRLVPESPDEVVARKGDDVLWIHKQLAGSDLDLLAIDPPTLEGEHYLYEFFQRDNYMRLLPLIHFLAARSPWSRPPLRACLMFDDPNLHWKSYGYIDFPELAEHARKHNYHASFATVPFDGWFVHRATAALFREHKERLSLLVHGNNHTLAELAAEYPNGDRLALMAQALRRIERLQKRTGLDIPCIMAAPHGGCSAEMSDALLQVGFEAATISRWSLMHYNPGRWNSTIGFNIAEFLGEALPIIPRFKLAHEREVDIYLTAMLRKPIILVGHHDDLRNGLGILAEFSARINSVGDVQWMDMKAMARSNFCRRMEADTLHIKMYCRHMTLKVPQGAKQVVIHRPWLKPGKTEPLQWAVRSLKPQSTTWPSETCIPAIPGSEIEITSVFQGAVDPSLVPSRRTSLWAAARRGFCEARDRIQPAIGSLKRLGGNHTVAR